MQNGARIRPPEKQSSQEEGDTMSNAKLAAFAAALILGVSSTASAQSSLAVKAPPGITRTRLVAWCKDHPNARADCREVRGDTREIRADRKEVRSDRRELRQDIKAGDKKEAKADKKELKSDRKDLRQDRRDRRGDVRDIRKDARK
jgi:outer membrane murein-binding lipoprotein Lpp